MTKKLKLLVALLFVSVTGIGNVSASARLDPEELVLDPNARPTAQSLYENCKSALKLLDQESNKLGFMESSCGVFMQGVQAGTLLISLQTHPDEARKHIKRMCLGDDIESIKNPSTRAVETSIVLSKRFIKSYERLQYNPNETTSQKALRERIAKAPAVAAWGILAGDILYDSSCNDTDERHTN